MAKITRTQARRITTRADRYAAKRVLSRYQDDMPIKPRKPLSSLPIEERAAHNVKREGWQG